jgi:hypothetical protein
MRPTARTAVAHDVDQAQQDLEQARIFVKQASARSDELLRIDMDLLARSRGRIADLRDRFRQSRENAPDGSRDFRGAIDRTMRERLLTQAQRHVASGQEHVGRQRERIAQLERDGHDAADAGKLLQLFEELQSMHVAHRDRHIQELGKAGSVAARDTRERQTVATVSVVPVS